MQCPFPMETSPFCTVAAFQTSTGSSIRNELQMLSPFKIRPRFIVVDSFGGKGCPWPS